MHGGDEPVHQRLAGVGKVRRNVNAGARRQAQIIPSKVANQRADGPTGCAARHPIRRYGKVRGSIALNFDNHLTDSLSAGETVVGLPNLAKTKLRLIEQWLQTARIHDLTKLCQN